MKYFVMITWGIKGGVILFIKLLIRKLLARLDFEPAYDDVAVQQVSHYTTPHPPDQD